MIHFANNLRIRRKTLGWTQARAAKQIGLQYKQNAINTIIRGISDGQLQELLQELGNKYQVTTERYQHWELGIHEPPLEIIRAIVEVFLVSDIMGFLCHPYHIEHPTQASLV